MGKGNENFKFYRADYDYMDDMPLEGWIWEIIRRSETYNREYEKLEKTVKSKKGIAEALGIFQEEAEKMGIDIPYRFHFEKNFKKANQDYFLNIELNELDATIAIPKPQCKYINLDERISIKGTSPVIVIPHEGLIKDSSEGVLDEDLLNYLAVSTPEDTIYVGISRSAKVEDIEKHLLPLLRKYLKSAKPRIRDDKWKYYLICYDLRNQGLSYKEIADILSNDYPDNENLFAERNIENYYSAALKLIQSDYKEYLY